MSMNPAEVEKALLALDRHDRAAVIHRALETLDSDLPDFDQTEIDKAWRKELSKRIEDIETGQVETLPFKESFARAQAAIAAINE